MLRVCSQLDLRGYVWQARWRGQVPGTNTRGLEKQGNRIIRKNNGWKCILMASHTTKIPLVVQATRLHPMTL